MASCDTCNDTSRVPCPKCDGASVVLTTRIGHDYSVTCLRCNGKGWTRCPDCRCDCGDNWTDGGDHRRCRGIP